MEIDVDPDAVLPAAVQRKVKMPQPVSEHAPPRHAQSVSSSSARKRNLAISPAFPLWFPHAYLPSHSFPDHRLTFSHARLLFLKGFSKAKGRVGPLKTSRSNPSLDSLLRPLKVSPCFDVYVTPGGL